MIDIEMIRRELRDNIAEGRVGDGMQKLSKWLHPGREKSDELVHLMGQYATLKIDRRKNIVYQEAYEVSLNKIHNSFLEIVNELREDHISEEAVFQTAIHERILVISNNEAGEKEMARFFKPLYFSKVEYDSSNQLLPAATLKRFDIVLFNYMFRDQADTKFYHLLEDYLRERTCNILYFGKKKFRILEDDQYQFRLYAANYVFSLYARIREMIDYRRYHTNSFSKN